MSNALCRRGVFSPKQVYSCVTRYRIPPQSADRGVTSGELLCMWIIVQERGWGLEDQSNSSKD